jgi:serine/threonine-protein kinase
MSSIKRNYSIVNYNIKFFIGLTVLALLSSCTIDDAEKYYNLGNSELDKHNLQLAAEYYSKAIDLNPNHSSAYNNRGKVKYELDDFEGAISDFKKALEIEPRNASANSNYSVYFMNNGDIEMSKVYSTRAIFYDSTYSEAYFNRAMANFFLGDYKKVIADLDELIKLNPDDIDAYIIRGIAYCSVSDSVQGKIDFSKAETLGYNLNELDFIVKDLQNQKDYFINNDSDKFDKPQPAK